jgi:hypothetical protein
MISEQAMKQFLVSASWASIMIQPVQAADWSYHSELDFFTGKQVSEEVIGRADINVISGAVNPSARTYLQISRKRQGKLKVAVFTFNYGICANTFENLLVKIRFDDQEHLLTTTWIKQPGGFLLTLESGYNDIILENAYKARQLFIRIKDRCEEFDFIWELGGKRPFLSAFEQLRYKIFN